MLKFEEYQLQQKRFLQYPESIACFCRLERRTCEFGKLDAMCCKCPAIVQNVSDSILLLWFTGVFFHIVPIPRKQGNKHLIHTTYFQKSKRKQVKIKHFQTKNTVFLIHIQTKTFISHSISKPKILNLDVYPNQKYNHSAICKLH